MSSSSQKGQVVRPCQDGNSEDDPNPVPRSRPRSRTLGISGSIAWCPRPTAPALCSGTPMEVDSTAVAAAVSPSVTPDLPFDILTTILRIWHGLELDHASEPYSVVPYRAGSVCRSWREAARHTPHLWTRATFNFRRMQRKDAWLMYHAAHAVRAGSHEYDVYIHSNLVNISRSDRVWEYFCNHILRRARTISIEIRFEGSDEDVLYGCSLPCLRRLEIFARPDFNYTPSLLLDFDAPLLTSIQAKLVNPCRLDSVTVGDPLSNILTLQFTYSTFLLEHLESLMLFCPSLRELHLTIQVFEGSAIAPVNWRGLRRLTIDTAVLDSDNLLGQLCFPNLEQLAVRDDPHHWAFWASLIEHQCPALTSLVVLRNHQDYSAPFVREMAGLTRLQTIIFRAGSMNNHMLDLLIGDDAARFQNFPHLRAVRFEDTVPRSDIDIARIWSLIYWRNHDIDERGFTPTFRIFCSTRRRDPDCAESREENDRRADLEQIVDNMSKFATEECSRLFR